MPRTRSIAWSELKVGIISVIAVVLAFTMIVAVGGQGGYFWQMYPLKTTFADAQGMKSGTVVRLAGKDIGKVTSVQFAGTGIEVGLKVNKEVRHLITTNSHASIGSLSLLGEPIIEVSPAPDGRPLNDYEYVPSAKAKGSLSDLSDTIGKGLEDANRLLSDIRSGKGTVGKLFTDDAVYKELNQFMASAAEVSRNIQAGRGTIGALAKDPAAYNALKVSLDNLSAATNRLNSGQGALGRLLNDEAMGQSLATAISGLEGTVGRLNKGEGTLGRLITERELYDKMNSLTAHIDVVTAGLASGQGTIGKLLKDEQLYGTINKVMAELQLLIVDIRKDPKKFLTMRVSIF